MVKQREFADFLDDVSRHQTTILRDDGLYRHVRFRRPGTYCMGFDLVTWPGYLAYYGDMGEFVFSRLPDMFEFFRGAREGAHEINPQYWSEKCCAADTSGAGIKEYQPELFIAAIERRLVEMEAGAELRAEVEAEVLSRAHDGEHEAMRAATDFDHDGEIVFPDFWETSPRDYTYRFIWCCHALAWGIRQYDEAKVNPARCD